MVRHDVEDNKIYQEREDERKGVEGAGRGAEEKRGKEEITKDAHKLARWAQAGGKGTLCDGSS